MTDPTEAELDLAERLVACECGHGLDAHNGLGCYERLSYDPVMTCLCVLTDDRTDAELLALRLPAYLAARMAEAWDEGYRDGYEDNGGPNPYRAEETP